VATKPVLAPDAAPAVAKPGTAAGNYAVNVGSFSNLGNANALVARLKAAGLPVTTEKVKLNGGDALRIRIGPYADRTAAEAARLRAESMAGGTSKVIALDAEERPSAPVKVATASKPAVASPTPTTPAPSATPTPGKPAATVTSGFAVQLAAPAEESAALALRDRARTAGFAAFVQRVDTVDGTRFRVRAGPVADHNAAEVMRDAISQKLGINGNIVAHP
jgi:cell division septation protein DedD